MYSCIRSLLIAFLAASPVYGQGPIREHVPPTVGSTATDQLGGSLERLERRLQNLEDQNAHLADQNARLTDQNARLSRRLDTVSRDFDRLKEKVDPLVSRPEEASSRLPEPLPAGFRVPPVAAFPFPLGVERFGETPETSGRVVGTDSMSYPPASPAAPSSSDDPPYRPGRFLVGDYDDERGMFVLARPTDRQRVPFELRFDLFTQARYFNFGRSTDYWVDSRGQRFPVSSFQSVEVTRNFIQFSGFGLDPRLQFNAIIFSSTAINDTVYLGWINYRFNRAFDLRVGNWLVPGTREWHDSFRYTMGADRLMATTFFRPNISPGIWAQGEPIDNLYYVAMFANSLNRFNQGVERLGAATTFGGTVWWEPRGSFGPGPSDIELHESPTPRIGTSVAISREQNQSVGPTGLNNPEDTILRLSDGTPLFRDGALAPGVELSRTSVQLWTIDASIKYRGLALNGEYFLRWLDNFQALGGRVPFNSLLDHGALLQAGYFAVPRKLEGFTRSSFVTGRFGGGFEVGGGLNWYVLGTRDWRMTAEFLYIDHSPAQNILTGYRAGESGSLFQLQWFSDF